MLTLLAGYGQGGNPIGKVLTKYLIFNNLIFQIACVSPSSSNAAESLNTLRYANPNHPLTPQPPFLLPYMQTPGNNV